LLAAGDVAIAISHSGRTLDVIQPFRLAAECGATTVAITSQPRSSLAKLADYVLISAARDEPLRPGAMAGRTSQLLVCDAIFVGVAQRHYDASLLSLERTRVTADRRSRRRKSDG
jgi:DNA-binding MurR/RpiR family transcriptional regulator